MGKKRQVGVREKERRGVGVGRAREAGVETETGDTT